MTTRQGSKSLVAMRFLREDFLPFPFLNPPPPHTTCFEILTLWVCSSLSYMHDCIPLSWPMTLLAPSGSCNTHRRHDLLHAMFPWSPCCVWPVTVHILPWMSKQVCKVFYAGLLDYLSDLGLIHSADFYLKSLPIMAPRRYCDVRIEVSAELSIADVPRGCCVMASKLPVWLACRPRQEMSGGESVESCLYRLHIKRV